MALVNANYEFICVDIGKTDEAFFPLTNEPNTAELTSEFSTIASPEDQM
jgi:hypothetical protein